MPLQPPALDDRSFDDLVEELIARIPAHTPEWTNPRQGDPGRTLIELFAWLTETLLYRVNLIPERQRLAFLRLLGLPLRPAVPARGIVTLTPNANGAPAAISVAPYARIPKPAPFETLSEITVLPIEGEAYVKRPLTGDERTKQQETIAGLQSVYGIAGPPAPYQTSAVFANGRPDPAGVDLTGGTIDHCLWVALFAPKPEQVSQVREVLAGAGVERAPLLNIGIVPTIEVPELFEEIGNRARIPHLWEISSSENEAVYTRLDAFDGTNGLSRRGIVRLAMPTDTKLIVSPIQDVRAHHFAGVGDRPPRLDDPKKAERLVCWLRLRPDRAVSNLSLSWAGVNAVEIDQRETLSNRIVGYGDGRAAQEIPLGVPSVEAATLRLEVEEPNLGYRPWFVIDDLQRAGRDDRVYELDAEAGLVRFGDGVRGRIPQQAMRIRITRLRTGGGTAGNLPSGSLTEISARDLDDRPVSGLKVVQSLQTEGGDDAETLPAAEQRIPAFLRHRDRTVTAADYRHLAAETPGVRLGRVEILPRFKPQQRQSNVPGVVSVMVLPQAEPAEPPNPRPDRPMIERVFAYLDPRRPIGTELYVIGCEYIPLAVSIGVTIHDGFDGGEGGLNRDGVLRAVNQAVRRYLWPLLPGGPDGGGWPLARAVRNRELEAVVARVPGVEEVLGVNLFSRDDGAWTRVTTQPGLVAQVTLTAWQLPELLEVAVTEGPPPDELDATTSLAPETGMAIPVVPEVC